MGWALFELICCQWYVVIFSASMVLSLPLPGLWPPFFDVVRADATQIAITPPSELNNSSDRSWIESFDRTLSVHQEGSANS